MDITPKPQAPSGTLLCFQWRTDSIYCYLSFSLLMVSTSWTLSLLSCALEGIDLYGYLFLLQQHTYWLIRGLIFWDLVHLGGFWVYDRQLHYCYHKRCVTLKPSTLSCNGDIWASDDIVRCTLLLSSIASQNRFLLDVLLHLRKHLQFPSTFTACCKDWACCVSFMSPSLVCSNTHFGKL